MRAFPSAVKPDASITHPLCRGEVSPLFPQGSWMGHVFGLDQGVEFVTGEVTEFDGGLFEAGLLMVSMVSDFGGVVVADFGSERGDEHQRILDVAVDDFAVQLDADDAVIDETIASIREEFNGVQVIEDHDGLEDVELEIP